MTYFLGGLYMESERLLLRKWEMNDAPALYSGLSNKEVASDFGLKTPFTIEDAQRYIEDAIKKNKDKYAVVLKATNSIIGGCGIHNKQGKISGSMWIAKEYQGNGFGTEACMILVRHCFDTYDVKEMDNGFLEGNIASQRMQEKIGGVLLDKYSTSETSNGERKLIKMLLTKDSFDSIDNKHGVNNDIS